MWERLWEKVWNNLKCLKRCAFQCIQTALKVWKWGFVKSKKVLNQIKIWTLTSLQNNSWTNIQHVVVCPLSLIYFFFNLKTGLWYLTAPFWVGAAAGAGMACATGCGGPVAATGLWGGIGAGAAAGAIRTGCGGGAAAAAILIGCCCGGGGGGGWLRCAGCAPGCLGYAPPCITK